MKVYLRNTQTGWFYEGPSKWTPDQATALNLEQVARAVAHIFETHLENVEILLSYDDPRYDLVLPVPASPSQVKPTRHTHGAQDEAEGDPGRTGPRHKKGPRL
jgi:hypothetical protein